MQIYYLLKCFKIFTIHKLETTQVGPEMNIIDYNYNGIEMADNLY